MRTVGREQTRVVQPVRLAPMAQRVVLQAADDGEENGRVTWPDRRRLPEHFLARGIAQRAQFRSIRLHGGGKGAIRQHMSIHHSNATQRVQAPLQLDASAPACLPRVHAAPSPNHRPDRDRVHSPTIRELLGCSLIRSRSGSLRRAQHVPPPQVLACGRACSENVDRLAVKRSSRRSE
jgi:hypothetical protein